MIRLLCAVGLHARLRDRDVPTQRFVFSTTDEYVCRRCGGRWERSTIPVPFTEHVGVLWERIS